jgi:hypothetical protein
MCQQTVIGNVADTFYAALRSQALVDVSRSQVDRAKNTLDLVTAQIEAGVAAKKDDLQPRADYLNAQKQASGYTWTVTAGDVSTLIAGIYGSAENMSATTNLFPTHLVVSVDVWRKLGSQVDADKRPVFPAIGAPGLLGMNTLGAGSAASWSGMNPMGLEILVDCNLAAGTFLVVHAPAVEFYEQVRGIMSVDNPDL